MIGETPLRRHGPAGQGRREHDAHARAVAAPASRRPADEPARRAARRLVQQRHRDRRPDGGARASSSASACPTTAASSSSGSVAEGMDALRRDEALKQDRLRSILGHLDHGPGRSGGSRPSTTSAERGRRRDRSRLPRRPRHHTPRHRRTAPGRRQSTDGIHPRRAGRLRRRPSPTIRPSGCRSGRRWRSCSRSCSGCSWAPSTRRSSVRRCPRSSPSSHGNDIYVWAVTIYLLTSTISVPFWGKLSDLYGRKPMFIIGIVIFLVGSALSGLSPEHGPS